MNPRASKSDSGYATVVALLSVIVFALIAQTVLDSMRRDVLLAAAEIDRARVAAAADAGIALAVQQLAQSDPDRRWKIDGAPHRLDFEGTTLTIWIEDEKGKVALNRINRTQALNLFQQFGLSGLALETATDSFMDWRDGDDEVRPHGAEYESYALLGIRPRNGELRAIEELALIHGIGPELARKIAPYATVNFGNKGEFDQRFASPIAIRVMNNSGASGSFAEIARARAQGGDIPALEVPLTDIIIGRPLTIRVNAQRASGARLQRAILIELTGNDVRPYVVRARD